MRATTRATRRRTTGGAIWIASGLTCLLLLVACGGRERATRVTIDGWAEVLQFEVATSRGSKFPERLGDIEAELRAHLSQTDAWGKNLQYIRARTDLYFLASAGADGTFGNENDIIAVNGHFRDTTATYGEFPSVQAALEKSR